MRKTARIGLAAALLLSGASFAMAQNGQPTGGYPGVAGGANGNPFRPGIDETTSAPTAANPYYGYYNYYPMPGDRSYPGTYGYSGRGGWR